MWAIVGAIVTARFVCKELKLKVKDEMIFPNIPQMSLSKPMMPCILTHIGYDYMVYMNSMDPDVLCLKKANKLNHSLTHWHIYALVSVV